MRAFEGMAWLAVLLGGQGGRIALAGRRRLTIIVSIVVTMWLLAVDDVIGLQGAKEVAFLIGIATVAVVATERS